MLCPPRLRQRYREGRVLPFIGAGVSMSLTWEGGNKRSPSWSELVEEAARMLGFDRPELARVRGTDLQILEYFKRKHAGQTAKLTNWLSREADPPRDAIIGFPIHRELASLSQCSLFYTTNFDNLIERAFQEHGREFSAVAVEQEMGTRRPGCEIVKFHGDLDHPDQIVLTESDYERRLSLSEALDHRLRADLLGRVVLFIGYSFRDPNISYLFRLFTDDYWETSGSLPGDRAFIVVSDPSDFEQELFSARRIQVVPVRGISMTEDVAQLLMEMRG